ncbi:MAG: hypothetical protein ACHRXM_22960 [Isosphaerales bacterium]
MSLFRKRHLLLLGLVLAGVSFVRAPSAEPSKLSDQAEARYQAAVKQFDETWLYFQQDRIDSYQVYVWSNRILECRREMAGKPADHIAALDEHLGRMKKLEALIKKVRRLGFGRSYDVGSSAYYRAEAEYWLARAKSPKA